MERQGLLPMTWPGSLETGNDRSRIEYSHPMSTDLTRTTGTLVVLNWSSRGDLKGRKLAWYHATRRWKAERIGSQFIWVIPAPITWKTLRETLEATLVRSDKAVITFPRRGKAGTMSIHTLHV